MSEYHKILKLKNDASQEEIQAAYDKLKIELDPTNNDNQEFFLEEFKKIQEAYEALSNSSILATSTGVKNDPLNKSDKTKDKNNMMPIAKNQNNNFIKNWVRNNIKLLTLGIVIITPLKLFIHYFFYSERFCYRCDKRPLDYHTEILFEAELWIFGLSAFIVIFTIWFFYKKK